ncbi:MAG: YebC/PmpR family DNA-binding transcriptional regulator [Planctomycetes bacterium]|nr:YebC/PmpR family DNA-binding transcriptional regulator [Planctomycetota bacterium]
MAGHSHWAGIKHKKAINDAKKGKVFTKIAMLIYSAVKEGGGPDPDMNPRLRLILEKARAANMPKDNVKRAIEKASGSGGEAYEQIIYEGYAPGGVALMIETLTDNRNRTFPELRKIMDTRNGSLGSPGCVAYLFSRKGVITIKADTVAEDALLEIVLEAGAEDLSTEGEFYQVTTEPDALMEVNAALEAKEIAVESAELTMIPSTTVRVEGDDAKKVLDLVEALDDHDDVQNVHANFDISDELLAEME